MRTLTRHGLGAVAGRTPSRPPAPPQVYVDKAQYDGQFHPSKLLWALGNFSRFVRPGAQLVAVAGVDVCDVRLASSLMVRA